MSFEDENSQTAMPAPPCSVGFFKHEPRPNDSIMMEEQKFQHSNRKLIETRPTNMLKNELLRISADETEKANVGIFDGKDAD